MKGSLKKNQSKRFLSWMLSFNLLPDDNTKWASSCYQYWLDYNSMIRTYFDTQTENPLNKLPQNTRFVLSSDLSRTINFFNILANSIQLNNTETQTAYFHVSRIFTLILLSDPSFTYTQGCDRYVYAIYLLSLLFVIQYSLPITFAEASTFFLAQKMMQLSNITHYLMNPSQIAKHFEDLDKKLYQINYTAMKNYSMRGQSSVHFALRWEILMFAEEHYFNGLTLIWDQIIARKEFFSSYIEALCIAHFAQVPEGQLDKLQRFKAWDYKQLLTDANIAFKASNSLIQSWKAWTLCAIAGALFIGQVIFH